MKVFRADGVSCHQLTLQESWWERFLSVFLQRLCKFEKERWREQGEKETDRQVRRQIRPRFTHMKLTALKVTGKATLLSPENALGHPVQSLAQS